jgi:hypothetical protein
MKTKAIAGTFRDITSVTADTFREKISNCSHFAKTSAIADKFRKNLGR